MNRTIFITIILVIFLIACKGQDIPYKSALDTKPLGPTGAITKQVQSEKIQAPVQTQTSTVSESNQENTQEPLKQNCKDTDYGDNPDARGVVKGTYADGTSFSFEDACFGNFVVENNCEGDKPTNKKVRCARGCTNGFCI